MGKRYKKSKCRLKGVIIFSAALIIAVLALFLAYKHFYEGNSENSESFVSSKAEESEIVDNREIKSISGTIYDSTMQTLTLETVDGKRYEFLKETDKLEVPQSGTMVGAPVKVDYKGDLENMQDVTVIKITVSEIEIPKVSNTAEDILAEMTLEEKVGQMFIARCPENNAVQSVGQYHLGGYILFARDFENKSKEQVNSNIKSYNNQSKINMFIGVDEEGGIVNRISRYSQFRLVPFKSPQDLYNEGGWELIESDTLEKCELLRSMGINMNFAPVCDVCTDPSDYMYSRSFGKDAAMTAQYVTKVVSVMNKENINCVLKHFPGYGNNEDTHTGIAYDNRPYSDFENSDFIPFSAGINAGAGTVLVSHNVVYCMDPERPASLSKEVHRILREELGFDGVIITDDLFMDAVKSYASDEETAVMAITAGNDLLCSTDFEVQFQSVMSAVNRGEISEDRINESVLRILRLKLKLGII